MKFNKFLIILIFTALMQFTFCKEEEETEAPEFDPKAVSDSMGIGPITKVDLGEIDNAKAEKGKNHFVLKCSACHKLDVKVVGPPLNGVTQRRKPEWIMNMILNPLEMTKKDPTAKGLLGVFLIQMTFQNVTQDESREILEYFRQVDMNKK